MANLQAALGSGLLEEAPRSAYANGKFVLIISLLIGLACMALLGLTPLADEPKPVINMAMQIPVTQPTKIQPVLKAESFRQPTRPLFHPKAFATATQAWHTQQAPTRPVHTAAATGKGPEISANAQASARPSATVEEVPSVQVGHGSRPQQLSHPPGLAEDPHFQLDKSVAAWKDFQRDVTPPAIDNLREASLVLASIAAQGARATVYSLAHGARTGYFVANSVLGALTFQLNRLIDSQGADGNLEGLGAQAGEDGLGTLSRMLLEGALCFQQDFRAIDDGLYKAPWDMFTPGHRQVMPQYAVQQTSRVVNEMIDILTKGLRGGHKDDIGIWLDSPLYPDYYKNNFHYQTDGWMSSHSAKVYETSTEVVFTGRQDAMQRLSLLPLRDMAAANSGAPRILEVACGTGRFATFIRDNHPMAHLTMVDLSPFYLEAARENDDYWRKMRYPSQTGSPPPARFVQAAAEALPFEDASFDAVVCVYLFHEMPEEARAAAAAEMARVVAPGGMVILTDSVQRGDRPILDSKLSNFAGLNEPHYINYIDTFLPALFVDSGLTCDRKWVESSTKCLSFRKPASAAHSTVATAPII